MLRSSALLLALALVFGVLHAVHAQSGSQNQQKQSCKDILPTEARDVRSEVIPLTSSLRIRWKAPVNGACIDRYLVVVRPRVPVAGSDAREQETYQVGSSSNDFRLFYNLRSGVEYYVDVVPVSNKHGQGPHTTVLVRTDRRPSCDQRVRPAAPSVRATPVDPTVGRLKLSWRPADATRAACINGWNVEAVDTVTGARMFFKRLPSDAQSLTEAFQPGQRLRFNVAPISTHGNGSVASLAVTPGTGGTTDTSPTTPPAPPARAPTPTPAPPARAPTPAPAPARSPPPARAPESAPSASSRAPAAPAPAQVTPPAAPTSTQQTLVAPRPAAGWLLPSWFMPAPAAAPAPAPATVSAQPAQAPPASAQPAQAPPAQPARAPPPPPRADAEAAACTRTGVPPRPDGFVAYPEARDSIILQWSNSDPSVCFEAYKLDAYELKTGERTLEVRLSPGTRAYAATQLRPGVEYAYTLTAIGSNVESDPSTAMATTLK